MSEDRPTMPDWEKRVGLVTLSAIVNSTTLRHPGGRTIRRAGADTSMLASDGQPWQDREYDVTMSFKGGWFHYTYRGRLTGREASAAVDQIDPEQCQTVDAAVVEFRKQLHDVRRLGWASTRRWPLG